MWATISLALALSTRNFVRGALKFQLHARDSRHVVHAVDEEVHLGIVPPLPHIENPPADKAHHDKDKEQAKAQAYH